jgi:hypothetical protein
LTNYSTNKSTNKLQINLHLPEPTVEVPLADLVETFRDDPEMGHLKKTFDSRVARLFLVKHTKPGKYVPNDRKIYQHFAFQRPPKYTQIWDFWYENTSSGNTV